MIWKNIKIHNAAELLDYGDGVTWKRFPQSVISSFEKGGLSSATIATGVELRFVPLSDEVTIVMQSTAPAENEELSTFHVYYGSIQGGWMDHERGKFVPGEPHAFKFKKPSQLEKLRRMTAESGSDFSPEVVRVIFDRGYYKLIDVIGDVRPPLESEEPRRKLLCYGSSITHGSNSIDASHSWVSVLAHNLGFDVRNLGMAGCCAIEHETIDYIAAEDWDAAVLELGINVLVWDEEKIRERVEYALKTVAKKNPTKPIVVISPFYCNDDFEKFGNAEKWRSLMSDITEKLSIPNIHYHTGIEFINSMSDISADFVHPNIYGMQKIADGLTAIFRELL